MLLQAKRGGTELWQVCYKVIAYVTYVRTWPPVTEATVEVFHNRTTDAVTSSVHVQDVVFLIMSHLHINDKVFITARFNGKVFNALVQTGQHTKKKRFKNNLSKNVSNIWGYPSFRLLGQWTWLLQHVNNQVFASSCLFLSRSSRIQDQTDKLTVTLAIHTAPGLKLLNNSVVPVCWLFFFFPSDFTARWAGFSPV